MRIDLNGAWRWSRRGRTVVVLGALMAGLSACSWFTGFVEQPKLDPWEAVSYPTNTLQPSRGNPQYSVPITGTFAAAFQVSYSPMPQTVDSMSGLKNPTAAAGTSLVNGRKQFQINCAVCHGPAGLGDGPAGRYGMPPPSLVVDHAKNLSDGYIFGVIRNGRGAMPTYDRIEEMDRWDVVNYVRGLQGKLPEAVPTGPVGYPGQTGAALPGATIDGPTRPAPFTAALMDSARMVRPQTNVASAPPTVTPTSGAPATRAPATPAPAAGGAR